MKRTGAMGRTAKRNPIETLKAAARGVTRRTYMKDGPFPVFLVLVTALVGGLLLQRGEFARAGVSVAVLLVAGSATEIAWKLAAVNLVLLGWTTLLLARFARPQLTWAAAGREACQIVYGAAKYLPAMVLGLAFLVGGIGQTGGEVPAITFYGLVIAPLLNWLLPVLLLALSLAAAALRLRAVGFGASQAMGYSAAGWAAALACLDCFYCGYYSVGLLLRCLSVLG